MKIHAQHNQWEAKWRTGCCMWFRCYYWQETVRETDRAKATLLPWPWPGQHYTSDISWLTFAPAGLQGDPPDWSRGKSASSGSFSARLPTPLTVCRLDRLWPVPDHLSPSTLLLKINCLKYGSLFPLGKKKIKAIVTFYITIQTFFLTTKSLHLTNQIFFFFTILGNKNLNCEISNQLWDIKSESWEINSQFWEKSQLREKSEL